MIVGLVLVGGLLMGMVICMIYYAMGRWGKTMFEAGVLFGRGPKESAISEKQMDEYYLSQEKAWEEFRRRKGYEFEWRRIKKRIAIIILFIFENMFMTLFVSTVSVLIFAMVVEVVGAVHHYPNWDQASLLTMLKMAGLESLEYICIAAASIGILIWIYRWAIKNSY